MSALQEVALTATSLDMNHSNACSDISQDRA
jgi:hypothetical protein